MSQKSCKPFIGRFGNYKYALPKITKWVLINILLAISRICFWDMIFMKKFDIFVAKTVVSTILKLAFISSCSRTLESTITLFIILYTIKRYKKGDRSKHVLYNGLC